MAQLRNNTLEIFAQFAKVQPKTQQPFFIILKVSHCSIITWNKPQSNIGIPLTISRRNKCQRKSLVRMVPALQLDQKQSSLGRAVPHCVSRLWISIKMVDISWCQMGSSQRVRKCRDSLADVVGWHRGTNTQHLDLFLALLHH